MRVDGRARLDPAPGEGHGEAPGRPLGAPYADREHEHAVAQQPPAGIDGEVAHRPVPVVEVERLDPADVPVTRTDREAYEALGASQHRYRLPRNAGADFCKRSAIGGRYSAGANDGGAMKIDVFPHILPKPYFDR